MFKRTSLQNRTISYPVIFCLMTVLSHSFAQNHYDYTDYSYRHGRDYQYDEEYDDDYDKTGKCIQELLSKMSVSLMFRDDV